MAASSRRAAFVPDGYKLPRMTCVRKCHVYPSSPVANAGQCAAQFFGNFPAMTLGAGKFSQQLIFLRRPGPVQEHIFFNSICFENHLMPPKSWALNCAKARCKRMTIADAKGCCAKHTTSSPQTPIDLCVKLSRTHKICGGPWLVRGPKKRREIAAAASGQLAA
jgi:hypothetical protein